MQQREEPMVADGSRRGRHLAPILTSFDHPPSQTLHRPHPIETIFYEKRDEHFPPAPPVATTASLLRESKFNLRGLFNRSRSASHVDSEPRSFVTNAATSSAQRPLLDGSLRSKTADVCVRPSVTEQPPVESSGQSKHSETSFLRGRLSRPNRAWESPPLFQAYPQAVKHACLQASISSADTILRMSNNNVNKNVRDQMMSSSLDLRILEDDVQRKTDDDTKKKHKRRMSGSTSKPEWTQKIYVLNTSGYLLQYSAEGSFDRLPEKVMQLGKDSAAFACDLIPGKHWVLQISQTATDEGVVGTNLTRSVLARMKMHRTDHRTSTSNFLLILNNPEEMDAWLVAVRKEIEALGGRKCRRGIGSRKTTEEAVQQLREKPSRRYLIKRDPNHFPDSETPQGLSPCVWGGHEPGLNSWVIPGVEAASISSSRRQSYHTRPSMESPSVSRKSVEDERSRLVEPQEGSRLSYLSTGTRTLVASRGSSTATSSTKVDPTSADLCSSIHAASELSMTNTRRTSVQTVPPPLDLRRKSFDPCTRRDSSGHRSTHADTEGSPTIKSQSPSTPNFSVPSFSKRYSSAPNGSKASNNPNPPLLPPNYRPPPPTLSITNEDDADLGGRHSSTDEQSFPKTDRSQSRTTTVANMPSKSLTPPEASSTLSAYQFPRRYSSLEYSRVTSQFFPSNHNSQAPGPPPSTALPAVPPPSTSQQTAQNTVPANAKKLRRPASMQVGSSKSLCKNPRPDLPTSGTRTAASAMKIHNRRSRAEFAAGPPTAPPPKCPLPATPLELMSC